MPASSSSTRQPVVSKHIKGWQEELRKACLSRVQEQREKLLQKCRSQSAQDCLTSLLAEVTANAVFAKGPAESVEHSKKRDSRGAEGSLMDIKHLTVEEHQDLMSQMEAALFDESYREELEALEAAEIIDISDMFATHCMVNHGSQSSIQVLCPVCRKAYLSESAFGTVSCPIDKFEIDAPMQGLSRSLDFVHDSICKTIAEHSASGCLEDPSFFVKKTGVCNLYLACYTCGALDVVL